MPVLYAHLAALLSIQSGSELKQKGKEAKDEYCVIFYYERSLYSNRREDVKS